MPQDGGAGAVDPLGQRGDVALLPPGGDLAHRDPFAGSLRYHLGLSTPNSEKLPHFRRRRALPLARR
jgi:hypothetical protein